MSEKRLLYFALGMLTVVSIGAVSLHSNGIGFPDGSFQAVAAAPAGKAFYLTAATHPGGTASTACASGYHMGTLWEIAQPQNHRYADEVTGARTATDRIAGPPAGIFQSGWVRSGGNSLTTNSVGANCALWASSGSTHFGTQARLESTLAGTTATPGWIVTRVTCNAMPGVWCVED